MVKAENANSGGARNVYLEGCSPAGSLVDGSTSVGSMGEVRSPPDILTRSGDLVPQKVKQFADIDFDCRNYQNFSHN